MKTDVKRTKKEAIDTSNKTSGTEFKRSRYFSPPPQESIDSSLQQLFAEADKLFKRLDISSESIRNLETNLINLKANFPFRFLIAKEPESAPLELKDEHKNISDATGYKTQISWYLAWDLADENSKTFRLLLVSEIKEIVHVNVYEHWFFHEVKFETLTKKPLIETDLKTRLQYLKYLTPFVDAFAAYLKKCHDSLDQGSIPFGPDPSDANPFDDNDAPF